MKGTFIAAWLAGEAIVVWRMVHRDHQPPVPGALLGVTALFLGLGAVAEYTPAAGLAAALAWGLDIAALMNVLPQGLGGQIAQAQAASAAQMAPGGAPAQNLGNAGGTSSAGGGGGNVRPHN